MKPENHLSTTQKYSGRNMEKEKMR
jgi:hypothetical protein